MRNVRSGSNSVEFLQPQHQQRGFYRLKFLSLSLWLFLFVSSLEPPLFVSSPLLLPPSFFSLSTLVFLLSKFSHTFSCCRRCCCYCCCCCCCCCCSCCCCFCCRQLTLFQAVSSCITPVRASQRVPTTKVYDLNSRQL